MAQVILQQLKPAANAPATIYTVPTGRRARVRVFAVSVDGCAASLWLIKSGQARNDNLNLLVPGVAIGAKNSSDVAGGGSWVYMAAGDKIDVSSSNGDCIYHVNGYEDSQPTD